MCANILECRYTDLKVQPTAHLAVPCMVHSCLKHYVTTTLLLFIYPASSAWQNPPLLAYVTHSCLLINAAQVLPPSGSPPSSLSLPLTVWVRGLCPAHTPISTVLPSSALVYLSVSLDHSGPWDSSPMGFSVVSEPRTMSRALRAVRRSCDITPQGQGAPGCWAGQSSPRGQLEA